MKHLKKFNEAVIKPNKDIDEVLQNGKKYENS